MTISLKNSPLLLNYLWISLLLTSILIGNSGCEDEASLGTPVITSPDQKATVSNCIRIFWRSVTKAESYTVEIAREAEFTNVIFQETILAPQNNMLYAADVNQDSILYIRVNATDEKETSAWSNAIMTTGDFDVLSDCTSPIPTTPSLEAPVNLRLVSGLPINFQWQDVAGAERYEFELYLALDESTRGEGVPINPSNSPENRITRTNNTYSSGALQIGQSYFWRVRAIGNGTTTPWSNQWLFTITP